MDKLLIDAGLKPSTQAVYLSAVKRVEKLLDEDLLDILARPRISYGKLSDLLREKSIYTLLTTVASLVAVMKHIGYESDSFVLERKEFGEEGQRRRGGTGAKLSPAERIRVQKQWARLQADLATEVDTIRSSGQPYGRQQKNALVWDDVLRQNSRIQKERPGTQESLLSGFYVYLEPRRQSDYHRLFLLDCPSKIERAAKEPAYVDLTAERPFVKVMEFKTAKTKGPWTKELPPELLADLRLFLSSFGKKRDYVFQYPDGRPYNVDNFTKYHNSLLKKWFGEHVSNNSLRHARATHVFGDPSVSYGERKRIAHDMGHSLDTSMSYSTISSPQPEQKGRQKQETNKVKYTVVIPSSSRRTTQNHKTKPTTLRLKSKSPDGTTSEYVCSMTKTL